MSARIFVRFSPVILFVVALLVLPSFGAEEGALSLEDAIFQEKCTLCHSSKRIFTVDPEDVRATIERMQAKNPDWITDAQLDHVVEVAAKALNDGSMIATRNAWKEAVARGESLFRDATLGGSGKSCADCHDVGEMKQVADGYPKYDGKKNRIVTFEQQVRFMIIEQMKGKADDPGDQRILDLMAFLKSLY
jgi:cytochrome c